MLSALTLLRLDEMMARYASYEQLAQVIRFHFEKPDLNLKELFARLVFNILVSNNDDHARNHAVFWNGHALSLTPAFDLCPQNRSGSVATQAMLIVGQERRSQLTLCLAAAGHFLLSQDEAISIIKYQVDVIQAQWDEICRLAELTDIEKNLFWQRQFLNPYAFLDLPNDIKFL